MSSIELGIYFCRKVLDSIDCTSLERGLIKYHGILAPLIFFPFYFSFRASISPCSFFFHFCTFFPSSLFFVSNPFQSRFTFSNFRIYLHPICKSSIWFFEYYVINIVTEYSKTCFFWQSCKSTVSTKINMKSGSVYCVRENISGAFNELIKFLFEILSCE